MSQISSSEDIRSVTELKRSNRDILKEFMSAKKIRVDLTASRSPAPG